MGRGSPSRERLCWHTTCNNIRMFLKVKLQRICVFHCLQHMIAFKDSENLKNYLYVTNQPWMAVISRPSDPLHWKLTRYCSVITTRTRDHLQKPSSDQFLATSTNAISLFSGVWRVKSVNIFGNHVQHVLWPKDEKDHSACYQSKLHEPRAMGNLHINEATTEAERYKYRLKLMLSAVTYWLKQKHHKILHK